MKRFFSRYLHWLTLAVVTFNFSTMFFGFNHAASSMVAAVFGGIGFLSVVWLAFLIEKQIKKQKKEK